MLHKWNRPVNALLDWLFSFWDLDVILSQRGCPWMGCEPLGIRDTGGTHLSGARGR